MRFEHAHAQGIVQRLQTSLQGWAQSRLSPSSVVALEKTLSYPGDRGPKNKYFAIGKLKSLFLDFFKIEQELQKQTSRLDFLMKIHPSRGSELIRGAPS